MSEKRLYIFDFDGTISYTGDDIATSLNVVRKNYGLLPLETDEVLKYVGYGARFLIENVLTVPGVSVDEILLAYKEAYFDHCTDTSIPYPGLSGTLSLLTKRGDTVSLFTNKPLKITEKTLAFFGIRDVFTSVYCPENLAKRKPDPEGIRRCMEDAGIPPERTVMVGDSKADIDAGRAAGVKTCGCLYGMGERQKLIDAGPDFLIEDIKDIANIEI